MKKEKKHYCVEGPVPGIRPIKRYKWAFSGQQAKLLVRRKLVEENPGIPIYTGDCTVREVPS